VQGLLYVAHANFGVEGGGADTSGGFQNPGAEAQVGAGEPDAFFGGYGIQVGHEGQGFVISHAVVSCQNGGAVFAGVGLEQAALGGGCGVGDRHHQGRPPLLVGGTGNKAFPANLHATEGRAGAYLLLLAELDNGGGVIVQPLDVNVGFAAFGGLLGGVMVGALGKPFPGALLKKFGNVHVGC